MSWDELDADEMPPRRIWLDTAKLKDWFEDVKRRRKAAMSGDRHHIEDPVENDAAKGLVTG